MTQSSICMSLFGYNRQSLLAERPSSQYVLAGMRYSEYQHAYVDYLSNSDLVDNAQVGGAGMKMDIYSDAIRRLHISVLPEKLPCRQVERDRV